MEHVVFRGTRRRDGPEIARQLDAIGGSSEAFTSKEHLSFQIRALHTELSRVLDLLSDLLLRPRLLASDIEKEKKVVLEEIRMYEDDAEETCQEQVLERRWSGHPLGRPILGTRSTVRALDRRRLGSFWKRVTTPTNLVVAAGGRFSPRTLGRRVREVFAELPSGEGPEAGPAPTSRRVQLRRVRRELEQVHLALCLEAIGAADPDRAALSVLNAVLGGCGSSRLFQRIREERGLVYTVYSYPDCYREAGALVIYAACAPSKVRTVVSGIREEFCRLADEGISSSELSEARRFLQAELLLEGESSTGRMTQLARQELLHRRVHTREASQRSFARVTAADLKRVARRLAESGRFSSCLVGRPRGIDVPSEAFSL